MSREGILPQLQERGITVEELVYSTTSVSVYRSKYQGYPAATKVQEVQDPGNDQIFRECQAMMSLSHPNILRMYDYWVLGNYCIIVTEWCNKDIKKDIEYRKVNKYPYIESDLWTFVHSMISALAHMQRSRLAHRDIKPANLFIDQNREYRVGDFGSSRAQEAVLNAQTIAGTPLYMSPALKLAMAQGSRNAASDPYKSDMYSLGLTLLEMAQLKYPKEFAYLMSNDQERMAVITALQFSEQLKAVLRWMLAPKEEERCNFIDLENWLISKQLPSANAPTQVPIVPSPVSVGSTQVQPLPCPFTDKDPYPLARSKSNPPAVLATTAQRVSPSTTQNVSPVTTSVSRAPVSKQSACCLLW